MKIPRPPHNWAVSTQQAITIQRRIAKAVVRAGLYGPPRLAAGLDAAFLGDEKCIAAVVLWDIEKQEPVEERVACRKPLFPYIPGLLTFREAPALIAALRKLRRRPDVLICDGQGLAHPRRCGIATHLGVLTDLPAVGCAKSRLVGRSRQEPADRRGAASLLTDGAETIGKVLRTRQGVKPVFVSVGHKIDLAAAVRLVLRCATRYRLPEPVRLADGLAARRKRQLLSGR